ncbi:Trm112 family protein [Actinotalea sp.]|uniref:Trm112 family protein n=1 Tax=Actinotalea sp. TaxID=1872145 RepID=UPI003561A17D
MSRLDAWARGLLRCPACGATLLDADGGTVLACEGPQVHRFPVRDGIPVLLLGEMVTDESGTEE